VEEISLTTGEEDFMDSKILLSNEIARLVTLREAYDVSVENEEISVLEKELDDAVLKRNEKQIASAGINTRIEELQTALKAIESLE